MAVTIRSYRPGDHGAGRALWGELTASHRKLYEDPTFGGEDPGAAFEEFLTRLDLSGVWVADDPSGGVVGLVGLINQGDSAEVHALVVADGRRREGIGRALLHHVAEQARKRGLAHLVIAPEARNEAAIRCLHAVGYDVLSTVELTLDLRSRDRDVTVDMHGIRFKA